MKFQNKEFFFIRHGESEFNANPNLDERGDYGLTHRGKRQAESLQLVVQQMPVQMICVSPLKRAMQTAEIACRHIDCEVVIIDALRECNMYVWNKMVELEQHTHKKSDCKHVRKFMDRAVEGVAQALSFPGPILIIAHGGVHFAMCHHFQVENYAKKIDNCVPAHFRLSEEFRWEAKHLASPCVV